jgi:hypothetical protein
MLRARAAPILFLAAGWIPAFAGMTSVVTSAQARVQGRA